MNDRFATEATAVAAAGSERPARRLTFFLSFGGSLTKWEDEGILDREILLPATLLRMGYFDDVAIFTYHHLDGEVLEELAEDDPVFRRMVLLTPPAQVADSKALKLLWSLLGPLRYRKDIARSVAMKTNQISGSWAAIVAKLATGRPLTLRLGYLLSRRHRLNGQGVASWVSGLVERIGFRTADSIVVTSADAREQVAAQSGSPDKVHLVPTYVDPTVFAAKTHYDFSAPILYVGRFTPQKNLVHLVKACAALKRELHLVGSGEQQEQVAAVAQDVGCRLSFLGRVPNTELARLMHGYTVFALPSLHEGLPKVLIEAMACGMICVGTDVPGTHDLITDGVNGYLARDTSSEAIATALKRALTEQKTEYGAAARRLIEEKFGIEQYARAEAAILLARHDALQRSDERIGTT